MIFKLKHIFVFFLVLILVESVFAQSFSKKKVPNLPAFDEDPIHFGFLIGVNTMNFSIRHTGAVTEGNDYKARYAEVLDLTPGINLGIVTSLKLRKNLNLRVLPGISFGQRNLSYIDEDGNVDEEVLQIKSTYIEMPIMLKYGSDRMHNAKPYLIAGINPRYDMAKNKQDGLVLKNMDLYYEVGIGFDSYLNYFRFSTEFKISIGTMDVLDHNGTGLEYEDFYTDAIDKMTSRIFVLSFFFE